MFKIATFGLKTRPLAKVPEVACTLSFYPKRSEFDRLFRFSRIIFQDLKIVILAMKFGYSQKFQTLHLYSLSTTRDRNKAYYIFTTAVSEI